MMDDKTEEEKRKKPEESAGGSEEGVQSEADKKVEQLNADTERINKAIAENENAKARQKLGGITEAGQQPVKEKEISDEDYAKKASAGELNLKKDDK